MRMNFGFELEPDLVAQFLELLKTPHVAILVLGLLIVWGLISYFNKIAKQ